MPRLIEQPTVIEAAGNKPKRIEEYAGRVNTGHERASVARMVSPAGWEEPGQRPEFEEITVVLKGVLRVEHGDGVFDERAGQAEITDPGESEFIRGEQVEYVAVIRENERLLDESKARITFERVLLGITKASLATESFISAASFQETTRVLTEAAVTGKRDFLRGLKETVVVGRLIPAGTGLTYHSERKKRREEEAAARLAKEQGATADEIEQALSEALSSSEG